MLLLLSIFALFLGPLTYRLLQRQPGWLDFLDAFIFVTISGLVLFHILPELLHTGGLLVLVLMTLGILIPSWIEKYFHKAANQAHQTTLFLGVLGLVLHASIDGSALLVEQGDHTAWLLAIGVLLHRFPVGITIWWLLRPQYGRLLPLIILTCMSVATLVGSFFAEYSLAQLNGQWVAWFQAFVMGSIMHVVLHRPYLHSHNHNQSHQHTPKEDFLEHKYAAGVGSILGVIVLAAVLLPHWLGYIEHGHDSEISLSNTHTEHHADAHDSEISLSNTHTEHYGHDASIESLHPVDEHHADDHGSEISLSNTHTEHYGHDASIESLHPVDEHHADDHGSEVSLSNTHTEHYGHDASIESLHSVDEHHADDHGSEISLSNTHTEHYGHDASIESLHPVDEHHADDHGSEVSLSNTHTEHYGHDASIESLHPVDEHHADDHGSEVSLSNTHTEHDASIESLHSVDEHHADDHGSEVSLSNTHTEHHADDHDSTTESSQLSTEHDDHSHDFEAVQTLSQDDHHADTELLHQLDEEVTKHGEEEHLHHQEDGHDQQQYKTALTLVNFVNIALYSAPMLLFAYFLSALMHYFKPKFSVLPMQGSTSFGKDATKGMIYGLPLPVCSPSASKMHQQLLAMGANQTFATAFLIAAPIVGFDAILISLPLLGSQILILRIALAAILAVSVAWLLGRHFKASSPSAVGDSCQGGATTSRFVSAIKQGYQHQLDHTAPWVLLGWTLAATLSATSAWAFFDQALWLQVLVMIFVAFPFALCATGITPIIAMLLIAGLSPGAAIAFLLIAPTISIELLKTLRSQQGFFAALSFAMLMLVGAFLIGLLLNQYIDVISLPWLEQEHGSSRWWQYVSFVIILVLYFSSLIRRGARSFIAELVPNSLLKHHHHH